MDLIQEKSNQAENRENKRLRRRHCAEWQRQGVRQQKRGAERIPRIEVSRLRIDAHRTERQPIEHLRSEHRSIPSAVEAEHQTRLILPEAEVKNCNSKDREHGDSTPGKGFRFGLQKTATERVRHSHYRILDREFVSRGRATQMIVVPNGIGIAVFTRLASVRASP